ncbi:MAG: flagellar basal body rod protein FlgC [Desulfobacterota bacterium]|nr:flagellar basal body rod protein FlgC [Thermodesulfobacteriota bacterium]
MNLLKSMGISSEGLHAQRTVMEAISLNLANLQTTRAEGGEPYRRKRVIFTGARAPLFGEIFSSRFRKVGHLYRTHPHHFERLEFRGDLLAGGGTLEVQTFDDLRPFQVVYDPSHPDANPEGFVLLPNVNVVEEMVHMLKAIRSYEANITAFNAAKTMALKALEIGR